MEVVDLEGLRVAQVTQDELAHRPWDRRRDVDVVRLRGLPDDADPPAGFVRRPDMLTWHRPLLDSEDEFRASLPKKHRYHLTAADRAADRAGIVVRVEDPVTPASRDAFMELYAERVAAMRSGLAIALRHHDAVVDPDEGYFGAFAEGPDGFAGGCLVRRNPETGLVAVRFSAVTAGAREISLARPLYLAAFRHARDLGHRHASLGDDPNLYGQYTETGLFRFKVSMGFACVPSQDLGDPEGLDHVDSFVSLERLSDPTMLMEYHRGDGGTGLRPVVLSTRQDVDTKPYAAPFLAPPRTIRLAGPGTAGGSET